MSHMVLLEPHAVIEAIIHCPCGEVRGCPRCEALASLLFEESEEGSDEAA